MRLLSAGLVASFLCVLPSLALAEERVEPVRFETQWYGWQPLVADTAALGLATQGGVNLILPAVGSYVVAAPVIHLVHGRVGAALGSLAVRIAMPVMFGQWLDRDCRGQEQCGPEAVGGLVLGMAVAVMIDATALSWESKPVKPRSTAVMPTAAVTKEGLSLGLAGVF